MQWYPKDIGRWKNRFVFLPKRCSDCNIKFMLERAWKVKGGAVEKYLQVETYRPYKYNWHCDACRDRFKKRKIDSLIYRFANGPEDNDMPVKAFGPLVGSGTTSGVAGYKPYNPHKTGAYKMKKAKP